ncbi:Rho2 protein [Pilobolus umbonatus]|nr:Rho2 protein [Pilobolus umbonatus]
MKKIVAVGDHGCGKSSLLRFFVCKRFFEDYNPACFEPEFVTHITLDGVELDLSLWNTNGHEDYDLLRPFSYPGSHVILICFAIDSPISFESVQKKWISEVRLHCPKIPILLVGCKQDLRTEIKDTTLLVTTEEGELMAQKIGAYKYLESSSKAGQGVQEVFVSAVQAACMKKRRGCFENHKCCTIL